MVTIIDGHLTLSDLAVYVSVAAAAILSVIIMCLQCKIIKLQRLLVRKGIVGSSSERSPQGISALHLLFSRVGIEPNQNQRSSTPIAPASEVDDPQTNIAIETIEEVSNTATPHSNTTPTKTSNVAEDYFEDSITGGYDVVKAQLEHSQLLNPIGYEDVDKVKRKPKSSAHDNPIGAAAAISSFHPPGRLCYEDVEEASRNIGLSSNSLNRTTYEDIEYSSFPPRQQAHSISGAGRFQIKSTKPQFAVGGDAASPVNMDTESTVTPKASLPEYSVVVKKNKKKTNNDKGDPANDTAAVYSVIDKPKKKKKGSNDSQVETSTSASGSSQNLLNGNHQEIEIEEGDVVKTADSKGNHDVDDDAPYKNVPKSDYLQQPLYSNCQEIKNEDDSDTMGDVSSREPAPPPIPVRSYSVGWAEANSVVPNGTDYDIPKELIPPEKIEMRNMNPVDNFV